MADPRDPREHGLDGEEAELARVLRALPAGEPSARVDAAVLAAARDAVSAGRPARKPRGLPAWAIGSAAAAVLAIGIGLQLRPGPPDGQPARAPAGPGATPLPAPSAQERARSAPARDDAARAEALQSPLPAPPPPAAFEPTPAPPAAALDPVPLAAASRGQALAPAGKPRSEEAPEQPEAAFAESEAGARERASRQQEIVVSGSRLPAPPAALPAAVAEDAQPALPPVDEDARLTPESWLERVRERLRRGDRAGARASLVEYRRLYPRHEIPADLAPLLK